MWEKVNERRGLEGERVERMEREGGELHQKGEKGVVLRRESLPAISGYRRVRPGKPLSQRKKIIIQQ